MSMKHGRYYTVALYVWHKYLRSSCEYMQIAMTEYMCDLMRMRECVKKRVAGENVEEEGFK